LGITNSHSEERQLFAEYANRNPETDIVDPAIKSNDLRLIKTIVAGRYLKDKGKL
jgi:hypothetical protein